MPYGFIAKGGIKALRCAPAAEISLGGDENRIDSRAPGFIPVRLAALAVALSLLRLKRSPDLVFDEEAVPRVAIFLQDNF